MKTRIEANPASRHRMATRLPFRAFGAQMGHDARTETGPKELEPATSGVTVLLGQVTGRQHLAERDVTGDRVSAQV
jgi:hypothetical protein